MIIDINTPEELYKFMKDNISYGFISQDGTKYLRKEVKEREYMDNIFKNYYFQSPDEVLKNKCGVCYDQVSFAKNVLENNGYNVQTFYTEIRNHVFLVYTLNSKYYYFERSFPHNNGIFAFDTLEDLFKYYLYVQRNNDFHEVIFYEYDQIDYGCDFYDFIMNIKKQNNIKMVLKKELDN